jgi:phospholipid/cholesterol/gamma-HCH transport system substrate-binding protein
MSALRRRGRSRPNFVLIGWLTVLAAAVFTYAAFTKQIPFLAKYDIEAVVSSSNQLRAGAPVRVAGVEVGKVSAISRGPGNTTVLKLEIRDEGRPVHEDARLRIVPRLFLEGGFTVQLSPGTPRSPELEDGGTIPLPQTARPVQFDEILSTFDVPTRQALKTTFKELATGFGGGSAASLRQTTRHIAPTLRDLSFVAEASRGTELHDLSDFVRGASRVTGALADRETRLGPLVDDLNRTAGALASQDQALAASVRELDPTLAATPGALAALERTLPPLDRFEAAIRPAVPLIPPTIDRLDAFGRELATLSRSPAKPSELPRLLVRIRPTLRDIPRLSLLVRGLYPLAGPIVPCLRDNLVPVLNSELDDGGLSTNRPVWQDFLHGLVGLSGTSQNFDANGLSMRYLFSSDSGSVPTPAPTGSRPVWRGNGVDPPPVRKDVPCEDQQPPNLVARAGGPGPAARNGRRQGLELQRMIRRFQRERKR